MDELFEQEVEAIKVTLLHLAPLSAAARERVIGYVLDALDVRADRGAVPSPPNPGQSEAVAESSASQVTSGDRVQDIRSLREEKAPKTANEMAALVAYYLQELAPQQDRKESISTADLERFFKIAPYPLPSKISNTLTNAAAAGYLDSLGGGKYKLNPVGYNLVVHGMPSGEGAMPRKSTRRTTKKAPARKAAVKKAAVKKTAAKKSAS